MIDVHEQETRSFVLFRLGGEEYGVAIECVRSIIRFEEATPVPRAPDAVMGVINMRGQVIPVVDLSDRFGRERFTPMVSSRIVVTEGESGTIGLAVDAASEVVSIPLSSIKPAPDSVLSAETAEAFDGVAERNGALVILLDLDQALPRSKYAKLTGENEPEGGPDV